MSNTPATVENDITLQDQQHTIFLSDQFEAYLKLFDAVIGDREQRCVDANELHSKLGVGKDFTTWIKSRLTTEQMEEKVDFSHTQTGVTVPHSSGGTQVIRKSVYTLTLEAAKIIASMERNDAGRKIRKWLVRVEDQVRQQAAAAVPLSRIELARQLAKTSSELVATLEREEILSASVNQLSQTIASSVLLPKVAPELGKVHISIKDIKAEFAPYLAEPKIRLVLRFYGQGRTRFQFGAHENANLMTFQRAGLDEVFARFIQDASQRISGSKTSVIIDHECFDGETSRVPKEIAIAHLGYTPADFGLAG